MSEDCFENEIGHGDCCCNCIHQRNVKNPKGFENEPAWQSYCDLYIGGNGDLESRIFLKPNPHHGLCEMHERK